MITELTKWVILLILLDTIIFVSTTHPLGLLSFIGVLLIFLIE